MGISVEELERRTSASVPGSIRVSRSSASSAYRLAELITTSLDSGKGSFGLLWITEYGIWPHFENKHLYYRLRSSYGDNQPLFEVPGHCFVLDYERADLTTFLTIAIEF